MKNRDVISAAVGIAAAFVLCMGAPSMSVKADTPLNGWYEENGAKYWYENGVRQGTEGRGKEIYDPGSDAWYWLDAADNGKMAVSKDVYQESNGGKWVRYDENGHMIKGWNTNDNGTYYFDLTTGAMYKGKVIIDGVSCVFDDNTGIGVDCKWLEFDGVKYWYEGGRRQGLEGRGKEIFDPASNAWYWLDSNADGKMAVSKDVYQPYTIQGQDEIGKWVRYDEYGHMIKGEDHRHIEGTADNAEWGYWYFDQTTGAMLYGLQTVTTTNAGTGESQTKTVYYDDTTGLLLKGYHTIGDTLYFFDPYTGEVINGWYADPDTGVLYWYENSARQGYNVNNPDYRGKEIYDPTTDAWYWLDNVQQGAVAKSKDVYQESYAGRFADREDGTGKWVRYDQWGKMIKGWDWGALDNNGIHQYFDEDTGAMAKGDVWIGDEHWSFDWNTGYGTRLN